VDETLIREGLAVAWRGDGAMRDELIALEAEARAARRGCLWRN
jgi:endonuclease YncB( thermonuclease family)